MWSYNQTFKMVLMFWMFPLGDVDRWTSVNGEGEACIILTHLFPEIVNGTCTHLMEKDTLFFVFALMWFMRYWNENDIAVLFIATCIHKKIRCILRGKSNRLQSKQPTYFFLFFLPRPGFEPCTFQSWVFGLAIWAITLLIKHILLEYF